MNTNVSNVGATTEPIGGQPSLEAVPSIKDFDYQIKYQRAFEAALWGLPAVAIYRFRAGAYEHLGYQDYSILLYSATATPRLEALTANSNTPYIGAYGDLRQEPLVVQVPTATAQGSGTCARSTTFSAPGRPARALPRARGAQVPAPAEAETLTVEAALLRERERPGHEGAYETRSARPGAGRRCCHRGSRRGAPRSTR